MTHKRREQYESCQFIVRLTAEHTMGKAVEQKLILTHWRDCTNLNLCLTNADKLFSCPGSSIPDLGQSMSQSLSECHFRIWTQRVTFDN